MATALGDGVFVNLVQVVDNIKPVCSDHPAPLLLLPIVATLRRRVKIVVMI
jgi:hypothetical protein